MRLRWMGFPPAPCARLILGRPFLALPVGTSLQAGIRCGLLKAHEVLLISLTKSAGLLRLSPDSSLLLPFLPPVCSLHSSLNTEDQATPLKPSGATAALVVKTKAPTYSLNDLTL